MNPTEFKPGSVRDFIGPARKTAKTLDAIVARCKSTGAPIRIMIQGDPGVGKSALIDYLLAKLGVRKWSVIKLSGTQLRLEDVEEWSSRLCYLELGGGYKVLRIEEIDRASHTARARLLMVLDDLPHHVAVVCTSNKNVREIEPRFISRFQNFTIKAPTPSEIKELLSRWSLRREVINRIGEFCCGNVRLALLEAQTALDEKQFSRVAA